MADNVKVNPSSSYSAIDVATDEIGNVHYPVYKISYGADGSQTPVDSVNRLPVAIDTSVATPISFPTDGANFDAFARFRVSEPETIFDSKQIHNSAATFWDDDEVSGSGTGSTWTQNTASSVIDVSATTAGLRVRQTFRRFNYQPGKSQLIFTTGTLEESGGGAGITRGWGFGDENNGFFLYDNEGTVGLLKRTSITGSVVDTITAQSSWNVDKMDGTGVSGITLDFTKSQILVVDMEWLGVGRVRIGFVINGLPYYCHEYLHTNNQAGVYISTPNLPIRYWIENDGTGAASELEHICSTVISEGGANDIGFDRSNGTGISSINANTVGTTYALCGLRLKSGNLDGVIRFIGVSIMVDTADDYYWQILFRPTVAGSPTWNDETNSVVQFATGDLVANPSATTVTGGTFIYGGFVKGGQTVGDISSAINNASQLGSDRDGTSHEGWLCVTPMTANADIHGLITWREIS